MYLFAVLGSQGIVVKCTAPSFSVRWIENFCVMLYQSFTEFMKFKIFEVGDYWE